jgi:hypothetical protein
VAEETYFVAFDIQQAGAANAYFPKTEAPSGYTEMKVGNAEIEGKGAVSGTNGTKSGLLAHQGACVVQCKMVELVAPSAAEAVKWTRANLAQNPGGERAVVKPNETNFQVIV